MENSYIFYLMMLGDSGVGKTSIRRKAVGNKISDDLIKTIGMDFEIKRMEIEDYQITLNMWDSGGDSDYRKMLSTFIPGVFNYLLVFDVQNKKSFESIIDRLSELTSLNEFENSNIFLVGNKSDLGNLKITSTEGEALANSLTSKFNSKLLTDVLYVEVSAKNGRNIEELFKKIGNVLVEQIRNYNEK